MPSKITTQGKRASFICYKNILLIGVEQGFITY